MPLFAGALAGLLSGVPVPSRVGLKVFARQIPRLMRSGEGGKIPSSVGEPGPAASVGRKYIVLGPKQCNDAKASPKSVGVPQVPRFGKNRKRNKGRVPWLANRPESLHSLHHLSHTDVSPHRKLRKWRDDGQRLDDAGERRTDAKMSTKRSGEGISHAIFTGCGEGVGCRFSKEAGSR